MDKTLERILSLLPKQENGDYKRGCKKELADYLGLPHNIVAEWVSKRNKSYIKYLYQISEKYNVSVEWLRGETDDPSPAEKKEKPPAQSGGLSGTKYNQLAPENRAIIDDLIEKLLKSQSGG